MVTQMISYQVVESGLEMRCLVCQAVEFQETGRQGWRLFEVVPDGPWGRCFIITCRACGHKNLRASMQPDWYG